MKGRRGVAVLLGLLFGGGAAVAAPTAMAPILYETRRLTVEVTGPGLVAGGNPANPGNRIRCYGDANPFDEDCENFYRRDAFIRLLAEPRENADFLGWGGACRVYATNPSCELSMTDDKVVRASFGAMQPSPQPAPSPDPLAKNVTLVAKPRRLERGDRTRLVATIFPCIGATQDDVIQFTRRGALIAILPSGPFCRAELRPKVRNSVIFVAVSPGDRNSLAATSNSVRVRLKKDKEGKN